MGFGAGVGAGVLVVEGAGVGVVVDVGVWSVAGVVGVVVEVSLDGGVDVGSCESAIVTYG